VADSLLRGHESYTEDNESTKEGINLVEGVENSPPHPPHSEGRRKGKARKILIVDDDFGSRVAMERVLLIHGYEAFPVDRARRRSRR